MKLKNKNYDVLAFVGRVVLPATAVLYATLGEIWVYHIQKKYL